MNKYSLFIASLTGISALSSANIERNSYKYTSPDRNENNEKI